MPDALRNGPEASQSKGAPELKSERTPASLQKNLDEERQAAAHRRAGPVAASKPAQTAGPTRQREIQIQFQTQGVLDESNLRHTAENGGIGLDFGVGLKPSRPVLEITPSKPSELSIQSSLSLGQPAAAPRFEVSNLPQMLKRVATEYAQSGTDYACFSGKYWARQRNYTAYMPFLTSALGELDQAYPEIMADSDVRRLVCQIRSEMSLEKLAAESRMFAERLSQRLAYLEQLGLHPSANAGSEGLSVESTRSMGFYDLLKGLAWRVEEGLRLRGYAPKSRAPSIKRTLFPQPMADIGGELPAPAFEELRSWVQQTQVGASLVSQADSQTFLDQLWNIRLSAQQFDELSVHLNPPGTLLGVPQTLSIKTPQDTFSHQTLDILGAAGRQNSLSNNLSIGSLLEPKLGQSGPIRIDYSLLRSIGEEGQRVQAYYTSTAAQLAETNPGLFAGTALNMPILSRSPLGTKLTGDAAVSGSNALNDQRTIFYCLERDLQYMSQVQTGGLSSDRIPAPLRDYIPHIREVIPGTQVAAALHAIPDGALQKGTFANLNGTQFAQDFKIESLIYLKRTVDLVLASQLLCGDIRQMLSEAQAARLCEFSRLLQENLLLLCNPEDALSDPGGGQAAELWSNTRYRRLLACLEDPDLMKAVRETKDPQGLASIMTKRLAAVMELEITAEQETADVLPQAFERIVSGVGKRLQACDLRVQDFAEITEQLHFAEAALGSLENVSEPQRKASLDLLRRTAQETILRNLEQSLEEDWQVHYGNAELNCRLAKPSCFWQIQPFIQLPLAELEKRYGVLAQGGEFQNRLAALRERYREKFLELAIQNYSGLTDDICRRAFSETGLKFEVVELPPLQVENLNTVPAARVSTVTLQKPLSLEQVIKNLYQIGDYYGASPSALHYRLFLQDNPELRAQVEQAQQLGADEVILPAGTNVVVQMTPRSLELQERMVTELFLQQQLVSLRLGRDSGVSAQILDRALAEEQALAEELGRVQAQRSVLGFLAGIAETESLVEGRGKRGTAAGDEVILGRLHSLGEKLEELRVNQQTQELVPELKAELLMAQARLGYRLGADNLQKERGSEARKAFDSALSAIGMLLGDSVRDQLENEQVVSLLELRATIYRRKAQTYLVDPRVKEIAACKDWSELSAEQKRFVSDSENEIVQCYQNAVWAWRGVADWSLFEPRNREIALRQQQDMEAEKLAVLGEFAGRLHNSWSEQMWLTFQADLILGYDTLSGEEKDKSPLRQAFERTSSLTAEAGFQERSGAPGSGSEWFWQVETHRVFSAAQRQELLDRFAKLPAHKQEQFLNLMPRLVTAALARKDPEEGLEHALRYRQVMEDLVVCESFGKLSADSQSQHRMLLRIVDAQVRYHFADVHNESAARESAISTIREARLEAQRQLDTDPAAQKFAQLYRKVQEADTAEARAAVQSQIAGAQSQYIRRSALIERAFDLELQLRMMNVRHDSDARDGVAKLCREGEQAELKSIDELKEQLAALEKQGTQGKGEAEAALLAKGMEKLQRDLHSREANCVALRMQEAMAHLQAGYGEDARKILEELKRDYGAVKLGDRTVAEKVDEIINEHDVGRLTAWFQASMSELARPTLGIWGDSLSILGCGAAGAGIACIAGPEAAPLGFIIGSGVGLIVLKVTNVVDGGWARMSQAGSSGLSVIPGSQTFWDSVIVGVDTLTLFAGVKGGSLLARGLGKTALDQAATQIIKTSASGMAREQALNLAKRQVYLAGSREASSFGAKTITLLAGVGIGGPLTINAYTIMADGELSAAEKSLRLKELGVEAGQMAAIAAMFLTTHYAVNRLSGKFSSLVYAKELEAKYRGLDSAAESSGPTALAKSELPGKSIDLDPVRQRIRQTYSRVHESWANFRARRSSPETASPKPPKPEPVAEASTTPQPKPESVRPAADIRIEDLPPSRQGPIREQQALVERLQADLANPVYEKVSANIQEFMAEASKKLQQMKTEAWRVVQNERARLARSSVAPGGDGPTSGSGGTGPKPASPQSPSGLEASVDTAAKVAPAKPEARAPVPEINTTPTPPKVEAAVQNVTARAGELSPQAIETLAKLNRKVMDLRRQVKELADPATLASIREKLEAYTLEMQRVRKSTQSRAPEVKPPEKPSAPAAQDADAPSFRASEEGEGLSFEPPRDWSPDGDFDPFSRAPDDTFGGASGRRPGPSAGPAVLEAPVIERKVRVVEAEEPSLAAKPSSPTETTNLRSETKTDAVTQLEEAPARVQVELEAPRVEVEPELVEPAPLLQPDIAVETASPRVVASDPTPLAPEESVDFVGLEPPHEAPQVKLPDLEIPKQAITRWFDRARAFAQSWYRERPMAMPEPERLRPAVAPEIISPQPQKEAASEKPLVVEAGTVAEPSIATEPEVDSRTQTEISPSIEPYPAALFEQQASASRAETEKKKKTQRRRQEDWDLPFIEEQRKKEKKLQLEEKEKIKEILPLDQWAQHSELDRNKALIRQYLRKRTKPYLGAEEYQRSIERLVGDLYHYEMTEEKED